ncbi:Flp pilus assembly protein CpaB [Rhodococcus sp. IEGM 1408]|uniref:Flp pilus assembly protein CpaB n=1 Tax=Rhodococcus sp. IEGM 1408 TaxID=3082220 RepID=UPI0029557DF7|nr:RcpC/CpaB family pilus assembly protein [Rhodococcus sp. IEGM 1408]MDV7999866.1 RcpC/CpaB family pilus assembly protein [Rhodococcus sp. IEGM 1408]
MNRRILSAIAAGVLAVLGAVLLVSYVNNADSRAMANMDPIEVLVVSALIPQGTPSDEIAESVTTQRLPRAAVGPDAVRSLAEVSGRVAATDLQPGEQLLGGRFVTLQSLERFGGIPVPEGYHSVTISLSAPQIVGGTITPGDTVGVFITVGDGTTRLILRKILVTRVQGGLGATQPNEGVENPDAAPVPDGGAMITMALTTDQSLTVVHAAKFSNIWLSLEDATVPQDGTPKVDMRNFS